MAMAGNASAAAGEAVERWDASCSHHAAIAFEVHILGTGCLREQT